MASLVHNGKYGSINTTDITTMQYYIVKYVSDAFTLQKYLFNNVKVSDQLRHCVVLVNTYIL